MNILLLNWRDPLHPKSGGAEIVTLEYAKSWVKAGHQVIWMASSFLGSKKEETLEGITIVRKGNSLTLFFHVFFFYLFSGMTFDLVVDEVHGIPFFTPFFVKKPKLIFIHEVANEIWDYMYPFPISFFGKTLEKLLFLPYRKKKFLTVSESTKQELLGLGILEKNISVIESGFVIPKGKKYKKEKELTCVFVSRIVKMKGVEEVIKAFAFVHKEEKYAKLWIVGNGEKKYIESLKEMVKEYGIGNNVFFYHSVANKEKYAYMARAHVLLHASVKEGWGLVVIEAASQGTPAVVYNVGGLKDSVINSKTGIVLKENSPREMATQVLSLIKDRAVYKNMQQNGIKRVQSLHWDTAIKKCLNLIETIANE